MGVEKLFSLEGKCAIVTGGTRGIGRAYAEILAQAGANVVVAATHPEECVKVAKELEDSYGKQALGVYVDVTKTETVESLIAEAEKVFGKVDIMVNNAGIAHVEDAIDVSFADYRKIMEVNLDGVFKGSQEAAKSMIRNNVKGSIINIGSMSAHIINKPQTIASYEASKAGVVHLTKALAVEWAEKGIRVNSVSPGYVMTELVAEMADMHPIWEGMIPMKRLAKPEEIAPLVLYLASDASSYVTGSDFIIDGGYTCI